VVGLSPFLFGVGDREVDQFAGGLLGREVSSGFDRLADLPVQRFDRVRIRYDIRAFQARRRTALLGSAGRVRGVVEESS
jgi:hypothetical protein